MEVFVDENTVWLTQAQMVELFNKNKRTISEHIRNIFAEDELVENSVVRKFRTTATDEKQYLTAYYNLDVIISVGYRVKSQRGTQFRIWATSVLREHLLRGYTIKQPASVEQLQELRDELDEVLERQNKMDTFVYEEFGKVYELLTEIIKQKKLEEKPRTPIGFKQILKK